MLSIRHETLVTILAVFVLFNFVGLLTCVWEFWRIWKDSTVEPPVQSSSKKAAKRSRRR